VDIFEKAWRHNSIFETEPLHFEWPLSLHDLQFIPLKFQLGFLPLGSSILGAGLKYVRMLMKGREGTLCEDMERSTFSKLEAKHGRDYLQNIGLE
jgi:hypothetical protein